MWERNANNFWEMTLRDSETRYTRVGDLYTKHQESKATRYYFIIYNIFILYFIY